MTVKGVKIGSLAYQTFNGRHDELIEKVPADIAALRAQGCEFIVVSYHWGAEKDYSPNDNQVRLGRATIDAGARSGGRPSQPPNQPHRVLQRQVHLLLAGQFQLCGQQQAG